MLTTEPKEIWNKNSSVYVDKRTEVIRVEHYWLLPAMIPSCLRWIGMHKIQSHAMCCPRYKIQAFNRMFYPDAMKYYEGLLKIKQL